MNARRGREFISINTMGFSVLGLEIRWYGVIIAFGTFLGWLLMYKREARMGLERDTSIDLILWVIPAALVCARAYYVLFQLEDFIHSPLSIFNLRQGGMAIYGGIIGGALAGYAYSRHMRAPFWRLADLVAPALALGQAVGRWGNFFNQEAYGPAVETAWQRFFPLAVYIDANGGWYYATFFYESLWCALLCLMIIALERRGRFTRAGDAFIFYAFGYAAERCAVEGLRADSLYIGSVRVSQLLSALVLCALAILLARGVLEPKIRRVYVITVCVLACALLLGVIGVYALSFLACAFICAALFALSAACYFTPSRASDSSLRLRK